MIGLGYGTHNSTKQLISYLVGPAGYGKSKVIEALQGFAGMWGRPNSIVATAFTACAAQNINDTNIHALLGWLPGKEFTSKPNQKQILLFNQISLLIIDEFQQCLQPFAVWWNSDIGSGGLVTYSMYVAMSRVIGPKNMGLTATLTLQDFIPFIPLVS